MATISVEQIAERVEEEHADHDNDFGGEHAVMKKLGRAIRFAREEA